MWLDLGQTGKPTIGHHVIWDNEGETLVTGVSGKRLDLLQVVSFEILWDGISDILSEFLRFR